MIYIYKYKNKKDKKYKYEYRIKYKDPITQKDREKSKKGFDSKPEALHAATLVEKKLLEGLEQTPISLEEYLKMWLEEYKKGVVRKNTYDIHRNSVKNHILPYFKNINLNEIKPIMYQKFISHLSDQGYSKKTIEGIHSTFHNACDRAVLLNKLDKNPCKNVVIKGKTKSKEFKYIESSDIPKFLTTAYADNYNYWLFFKTLIETGMRKGEAAAIQWTDIDLKARTIDINKTLDFEPEDEDELFGDTKTFNSPRVITISQGLANDLHFHMKKQNQNKLNMNELYRHDLNLVFCRNDGDYLRKSTLFNALKRILKKADIPEVSIHALRHTHAVLLLEAGASMKYVQERLGHGSMQITADVYSHISKKIETDTMSKFEDYTKNLLS